MMRFGSRRPQLLFENRLLLSHALHRTGTIGPAAVHHYLPGNVLGRKPLERSMTDKDRSRQRERRGAMSPSDHPALGKRTGNTGTVGPELQAHIGRQLRSLYDEVLQEPVPDQLRKLLADLEKKSSGPS
jgi:hypothetical protein